jgi:membrane protein required for colicin V production
VNSLDIVLLIALGLSVLAGFREGFARVGVGLIAALVGAVAGFWYAGTVGQHLLRYTSSVAVADFVGFFIVFVGFLLVGAIVGHLLAAVFKWVGLSWLDRLGGAAFGFARGAVVAVALITIFVACAPNPPPRFITQSQFAPYLIDASAVMATVIPEDMREAIHNTTDRVRKIWSDHLKPGRPEEV